ncbi:MAG: hypothetical protein ACR2KI_02610 [Candidatus Limnocylindria bacterium]
MTRAPERQLPGVGRAGEVEGVARAVALLAALAVAGDDVSIGLSDSAPADGSDTSALEVDAPLPPGVERDGSPVGVARQAVSSSASAIGTAAFPRSAGIGQLGL